MTLEKKLKVRRLELKEMVDCPRYEKLVSRGVNVLAVNTLNISLLI